ncbi:type VI secretion system tube protein TssD [Aquimarina latercula]|uniref:type VI secretion system tube protein TssD n=1 Tax=Aquimarina latercula TaxID=987 RepID=UPI000484C5B6|nr:type VI secretion system tube protein TssD [Aquimarina latercula]
MSAVQIKLHVDGYIFNVEHHTFGFIQSSDHTGRPSKKPINNSFDFSVYGSKDTILFYEWASHPSMQKDCKIEFASVHGNTKTRVVELWEAHCSHYRLHYNHESSEAFMITFSLSPATILHNGQVLMSHWWRIKDPFTPQVAPVEKEEKEPRIIDGWWSYDEEGNEPYKYSKEDNSTIIPVGHIMYFHAETKDIDSDEIEFQLYDDDGLLFDDDKFPNDPIKDYAWTNENGIATVRLELSENFKSVIMAELDKRIELYWKVSYKGKSKDLPEDSSKRLRVNYIRDLYITPCTKGTSLPEYYDKKGKLIVFAIKRIGNMLDATGIEGAIENFIVLKTRIRETIALSSELNTVKRSIYEEVIDITTNQTVSSKNYVVEEAASMVIKNDTSYALVNESEEMTRKTFSQYFNIQDAKRGTVRVFKQAKKALKFLDFMNVTKTMYSVFPQDNNSGVPKPSSVVSIFSAFSKTKIWSHLSKDVVQQNANKMIAKAAEKQVITEAMKNATKNGLSKKPTVLASEALTGLGSLMFVADVIATETVNNLLNDFNEDMDQKFNLIKTKGLTATKLFVQSQGGKISGYKYHEDVSENLHCKIMNGEITTFEEFDSYADEGNSEVFFTYFFKIVHDSDRKKDMYVLDCVMQQ